MESMSGNTTKYNRINLYLPLRDGGPKVWGEELAKNMLSVGFQVNCRSSILGYLSEPFSLPITHSTLPFFHPIRGKYVLTIHGNYLRENTLWSKYYPMAIRQADVVTVPSQFLAKELSLENAVIIPNGVNIPSSRHDPSQRVKTIGTMTNFNLADKADGILELAKILKSLDSDVTLLVAGDGALFEKYKKNVIPIYPKTKFVGYVDPAKFFPSIDIYAHYSLLDNQPISLLQAMSYALPVVSNDVGAVPETLSGELNKFLAKDSSEYTKIMSDLLNSKEMRKINSELSFRQIQEYDWNKVVKLWAGLYEKLLK